MLTIRVQKDEQLAALEKAEDIVNDIIFTAQVIGLGLALIHIGYDAGRSAIKREILAKWEDSECKTDSMESPPL